MINEEDFESTPIRLIKSAGEIFAKKGYKKATIREICELADANIASVNYHFRDKSNLYEEVTRYIVKDIWRKYPLDFGVKPTDKPERKLYNFIRNILLRTYSPDLPSWYDVLMKRDILGKSNEANKIFLANIMKSKEYFISIINELVGEDTEYKLLEFCESFTVGQVLYFLQNDYQEVLPIQTSKMSMSDINKLAQLITNYSIGGLKNIEKTHSGSES